MNSIDEYVRDNHPHYYPLGQSDCWFCKAIERLESADAALKELSIRHDKLWDMDRQIIAKLKDEIERMRPCPSCGHRINPDYSPES
jgi:predicted transcriptional regulator